MVRIDTSSKMAVSFFILFNNERSMNIDVEVKDAIELLLEGTDADQIETVILFGSQARGTATERSDIDLLIVTDDKKATKQIRSNVKKLLPEFRTDLHFYSKDQFICGDDLVLVDAKLYGVSIMGEELLFDQKTRMDHISTSYLKSRLRSVQENLERSRSVEGEARSYFLNVAFRTLEEISGVLSLNLKIKKSEKDIEKATLKVKEELFRIGDRVWLN